MKKKLMMTVVTAFGLSAAVLADVKLVNVGSNMPKLEELKANIGKYEEQAPFDGIAILLGGSSDVFNPEAFSDGQKREMRAAGEVYKSIPFKKWKYNLSLWITKAAVILNNLWTIFCKHKSKVQATLKCSALCVHCSHCWKEYFLHTLVCNFLGVIRVWSDNAHTTCVKALVTIKRTLVVH